MWVRDTHALQSDLHRAQRRAARRIFSSDQESSQRCLGAFLVHRVQRRTAAVTTATPAAAGSGPKRSVGAAAAGSSTSASSKSSSTATVTPMTTARDSADSQRAQMEELAMCTRVGGFERFGEDDVAFICDFCDGHLVWEDLESVPTSRAGAPRAGGSPTAPTSSQSWQATGITMSGGHAKPVVYPPLVVANHVAPTPGDWLARVLCPYCEEEAQRPQHEDDDEDAFKPEYEFDDVAALQEHLEWQHPVAGGLSAAALAGAPSIPSTSSCSIM